MYIYPTIARQRKKLTEVLKDLQAGYQTFIAKSEGGIFGFVEKMAISSASEGPRVARTYASVTSTSRPESMVLVAAMGILLWDTATRQKWMFRNVSCTARAMPGSISCSVTRMYRNI